MVVLLLPLFRVTPNRILLLSRAGEGLLPERDVPKVPVSLLKATKAN